jgi:hypothetical protein
MVASSSDERVSALLIRVRVAPPEESCGLMIRVTGRTDVQVDAQEMLVFGTETDALAWIAGWLKRVATAECRPE